MINAKTKTTNSTKTLLPKKILIDFLNQWKGILKFGDGLSIHQYKQEQIMVSLDLNPRSETYEINLCTDYLMTSQFIATYNLTDLNELHLLSDGGNMWLRYFAGAACVSIEIFELEAEICFRLINEITMVYSADLHYYDEVYSPLTRVKQFEAYIKDNQSRLDFAAEG